METSHHYACKVNTKLRNMRIEGLLDGGVAVGSKGKGREVD